MQRGNTGDRNWFAVSYRRRTARSDAICEEASQTGPKRKEASRGPARTEGFRIIYLQQALIQKGRSVYFISQFKIASSYY